MLLFPLGTRAAEGETVALVFLMPYLLFSQFDTVTYLTIGSILSNTRGMLRGVPRVFVCSAASRYTIHIASSQLLNIAPLSFPLYKKLGSPVRHSGRQPPGLVSFKTIQQGMIMATLQSSLATRPQVRTRSLRWSVAPTRPRRRPAARRRPQPALLEQERLWQQLLCCGRQEHAFFLA